jgi:putative flippase GtrA
VSAGSPATEPLGDGWWSRLGGPGLTARFSRYTAGSAVAFTSSEVALVACYGTGLMGSAPASVVAFVAGAVPNYVLNRFWVWKGRSRGTLRHELLPYVLVSLASLAAGAGATSLAASLAPGGHATRTVFVALAYLASNLVLFVAKFVIYHRLIFPGDPLTSEDSAGPQVGTAPST